MTKMRILYVLVRGTLSDHPSATRGFRALSHDIVEWVDEAMLLGRAMTTSRIIRLTEMVKCALRGQKSDSIRPIRPSSRNEPSATVFDEMIKIATQDALPSVRMHMLCALFEGAARRKQIAQPSDRGTTVTRMAAGRDPSRRHKRATALAGRRVRGVLMPTGRGPRSSVYRIERVERAHQARREPDGVCQRLSENVPGGGLWRQCERSVAVVSPRLPARLCLAREPSGRDDHITIALALVRHRCDREDIVRTSGSWPHFRAIQHLWDGPTESDRPRKCAQGA